MNNNNFFYNLTPDKIISAIQQAGFDPTGHCFPLNSFENRVYDLKLSNNKHIVAKFYRPGRWTYNQIKEEHLFLKQLDDSEIKVCAPLILKNNDTIDQIDNIFFSIWERTGGRAPDELDDTKLEILGRYMGRLHTVGSSEKSNYRLSLTGESYGIKPLNFLLENNFIPIQYEKSYSNCTHKIAKIYDDLVKSLNIPFQRIHGDCHLGNLLMDGYNFFFLDFDDFLMGPTVQDIWMIVPGQDTEGLRQQSIFLNAYRQFNDFSNNHLKLIEPLKALRFIHYAAWIARRWDDPAFPAAFPHFGSEKYWEDETRDLEEQLLKIENMVENKNDSINLYLADKDYFWDM